MLPKTEPKKSEQQIFSEAWINAHAIDWLFPENVKPMSSAEYLEYFHVKYGPMYICRCPSTYKFDLLERNKDKVAFSQHLIEGAQVSPYTMLQFGPSKHVIADWVWNEQYRKFFVAATVVYSKPSEY